MAASPDHTAAMSYYPATTRCTAFLDHERLAWGELRHVAIKVKQRFPHMDHVPALLVFNDQDGTAMELDLRGSVTDVTHRYAMSAGSAHLAAAASTPETPLKRGRGRPKLGVVPREVTLLPRHWQWLNAQPGGASVALRKLVEDARKLHEGADRVRQSQERCYRFMSAIAGNLPGFEEATRALFARDFAGFESHIAIWPDDIRDHVLMLAGNALHA